MMQAKEIYDILTAAGLTRAGALAMLGNMKAESNLIPNIVQRGMTNASDVVYTAEVDEGVRNFEDGAGYGLAQWTFFSRKRALLRFAKEWGTSVGDGVMQVNFCLSELQTDYAKLFMFLCSSNDIDACSDKICTDYEAPAINNFLTRRAFAHQFEKEIPEKVTPTGKGIDGSVAAIQYVMQNNGYWGAVDGKKTKEFFAKLREFTTDMEGC